MVSTLSSIYYWLGQSKTRGGVTLRETLKEEMGSMAGCQNVLDLKQHIVATIHSYNYYRKHSTLGSTPHAYYLKYGQESATGYCSNNQLNLKS